MRSTFSGRKSAFQSSGRLTLALAVTLVGEARAGEDLDLEELAARTHGAVVVKVQLGSGKQPAGVQIIRVIRGFGDDLVADPSWLGLCLPDGRSLRKWPIQYAKWKAKPFWRRARARGGYEAVVFVETYEGGHRPHCGVEAMQMRHTDLHPGYAKYIEEVKATLEKRETQP